MKLCKDCVHFDSGWTGDDYYLGQPLCCRPVQSPVYGISSLSASPLIERLEEDSDSCGKDAIYFEAIPQKIPFWKRIFKCNL